SCPAPLEPVGGIRNGLRGRLASAAAFDITWGGGRESLDRVEGAAFPTALSPWLAGRACFAVGCGVIAPLSDRAAEESLADAGAGLSCAPRTTGPPRQTVRARAIVQTAGREPGKTTNRLAPARG